MAHTAAKATLLALGTVAVLALSRPHAGRGVIRRAASRNRQPPCKVVVVGAGFGGLAAASRLAGRPGIDLTVIDAHNHHLFQPLLYQVATAALSPGDIASPVRAILPASPGVHVLMDSVTVIDLAGQRVLCGAAAVPYDELILATGSRPQLLRPSVLGECRSGPEDT